MARGNFAREVAAVIALQGRVRGHIARKRIALALPTACPRVLAACVAAQWLTTGVDSRFLLSSILAGGVCVRVYSVYSSFN
jgi:hypothetical protein